MKPLQHIACCVLAATVTVFSSPTTAEELGGIEGVVVDGQSALPLPDAAVLIIGGSRSAQTDAHGVFRLDGLAPAIYRLRVSRSGYQAADTDDVVAAAGVTVHVTLSLHSAPEANVSDVIGHTSTRASSSLQESSTITRTLTTESLAENGTYRAADALKTLPAVTNSITGDTGALGDDQPLDIRGLGAAETVTTLDGHPLATGASGGFNFQVSPLVGIRSYSVIYGTGGGDVLGVNAVGGVIDARTIDPTAQFQVDISQGYGTYNRLGTIADATGSVGRFGFAAAAGVYGLDGPIRNSSTYAPATSWDPSSTLPSIVNAATYPIDSAALSRTGLAKVAYDVSSATKLTFTLFASSYLENKTGNGDQDYETYQYALAQGTKLLGGKVKTDPCPSGEFKATNSYGVPYGTGPNGQPDGGAPNGCVTPAQYAGYNAGPAGAGPAFQTIDLNDEHLNLTSGTGNRIFETDLYTNRYQVITSRQDGLPNYVGTTVNGATTFPYVQVPGLGTYRNSLYLTSGGTIDELFLGARNALTVGYLYDNASDALTSFSAGFPTVGNSDAEYGGPFVRDVYRLPAILLTVYANAYFLHASATNSSYVNPRLALVFAPGSKDVVRVSAGASTTEPTANYLNQPFVPTNAALAIINAGGGGIPTCGSFSVGTAPSSILQPERGVDEELAYGHRFYADTQVQATVFNENVYNKIFSGITVPIDLQNPPFPIAPSVLSALTTALTGKCGAGGYTTVISETANLGQLQSRGVMLNGRVRFGRGFFTDFDYAVTSTALVNGVTELLQKNLTSIPDAQLPRVPLQTLTVAFNALLTRRLEARFDVNTVSGDNTKALPAYNYSDITLTSAVGPGKLSLSVSNVFNQWSNNFSLENLGVPLALNQYATASSYGAQIGKSATEMLALQPRMLFVNYTVRVR
jgi:outer membrane receptor for ferrienterochelin and colicin